MGRTVTEGRVSKDALFGGRVTLFQPAHGAGYRANVDAILLAAFAADGGRRVRLAIDLGAGVGTVGLTLFFLQVAERIQFVEKDEFLAELCRRNVQANRWDARAVVRIFDLEESLDGAARDIARAATLVVANPPYVAPERDGRSRASGSVAARLAARRGRLAPFVRAAAAVLGRRGRACFVYPAHALLELTTLARQSGLEPKRLRFVHGRAERPARIALVERVPAKPGGLVVAPPLIDVGDNGKPTAELAALLRST
jgi:tRNA1Val (adenine37-N6)-methyltransferase